MIGKVMPESDSDLEVGQEGQYRSMHNSPENLGYEGGDEGDSPKDLENGNNNNDGNEYQQVGAPTIGEKKDWASNLQPRLNYLQNILCAPPTKMLIQ